MNDFTRVLQIVKKRKHEKFVIATVIDVEGSSYRHEGAKMLIDEKGKTYGLISGGCLEEDIIHHAIEVLHTGENKTITYNLKSEDDLSWGQGAGCNGIVYIYLEVTGWNFLKDTRGTSVWALVDKKINSGYRMISVKFIDDHNKDNFYFSEDEEYLGNSNTGSDIPISLLKNFFLDDKKTRIITLEHSKRVFLELYTARNSLYIFGAGPDVEPLAELASKLDFSIQLIDPRSERCNKGYFPWVDQCIIDFPHKYLEMKTLPKASFVLIMTHNFQRDKFLLQYFINNPPLYLGILGPRKRTARLLHPLSLPEGIHSPLGMDIYAEGPEEIAVSVCAELIKVRNSMT